jgi:hypothetical protein
MADVTTTEYITRQAPGIEAYKLGLLESSKALADRPRQLPAFEAAALTPQQQQAIQFRSSRYWWLSTFSSTSRSNITTRYRTIRRSWSSSYSTRFSSIFKSISTTSY